MFKIYKFEADRRGLKLWLDDGDEKAGRMHFFLAGHLEAYAGVYGIEVGVALMLILADGSVEGLDMPEPSDPAARSKIASIVAQAEEEFEWVIDRNETLAAMTLADDTADMVKNAWAMAAGQAALEEPMSHEDLLRSQAQMSQNIAAGYQRRQEELVAEEFVAADPELSKVIRDTTPPNVGLQVKYV